jgi:hypothetical protein
VRIVPTALLLVLGAACAGARPNARAAGASAPAGAEREVVEAVERLFAGMRTRDTASLRALLAPELVIVSARETDTGTVVRRQDAAGFLRSVAASPEELRERMWAPVVRVDGAIATLWAPYDFHRGARFSHCGHDAFHLARAGGRWVITALTYTVRAAPCAGPPGDAAPASERAAGPAAGQPNGAGGYHSP